MEGMLVAVVVAASLAALIIRGCRVLGRATARAVVSGLASGSPPSAARPPELPGHPRQRWLEVTVPAPGGAAPAWIVDAGRPARTGTWAVHLHGQPGSRSSALGAVRATAALGMTSLVVSYRGDGEAAAPEGWVSRLGSSEWADVDAALSFAVDRGARRVVLVGWSLGAAVALQLAELSAHRALIDRLVLVRPVTDARTLVRARVTARRLPGWVGALALRALADPAESARIGLSEPIDFGRLDWSRPGRLTVPALVVHTDGDDAAPLRSSVLFAMANPRLVRLVELPRVGPQGEPAGFQRSLVEFLEAAREDGVLG